MAALHGLAITRIGVANRCSLVRYDRCPVEGWIKPAKQMKHYGLGWLELFGALGLAVSLVAVAAIIYVIVF